MKCSNYESKLEEHERLINDLFKEMKITKE
jgi:hypothetical protein